MKILASGDIHGDTLHIKKLAKRALEENVDLVILTGDITNFNESTDNLIGPFKKIGKKVLIIPGNHEPIATIEFLAELYDIKNIHGYSVKYEGVGIFGAGGSSVVGPSPILPEKEMFELLKKGFDRIRYLDKKIMVTHEHPSGTNIEKMTQFFPGSDAIRKAVKKFHPDLLLCSHVHEAEGLEEKIGTTRVISVGKKGMIINI
jgi:Icc-related predicted phosphoesterase